MPAVQGMEPRVIKAASEVTAKGYAKITLLGDPQQVTAEAKKLGADISGCSIVDPKVRAATGMPRADAVLVSGLRLAGSSAVLLCPLLLQGGLSMT